MPLAENTIFLIAMMMLLVSPATGSFLKFWADRLSDGAGVIGLGSRCDRCGQPLASRDVIPILSWVLSRGQTRCCRKDIRYGHISAETTAVGLALWGWFAAPDHLVVHSLVVAWLLQGIALLSAPGRRAAFALSIILAGLAIVWSHGGLLGPFEPHLMGALMGASFAALGILDKVRGSPTLILLPAGALLGVTALPVAIFLGIAIALAHRGWCKLAKRAGTPHATSVATGLAGGVWLVWLYGPTFGLPIEYLGY